MSRLYKSVLPTSVRSEYTENENVSFRLSFEGQQILPNSVRICGNLTLADEATTTSIDAVLGIHGCWSACSVEMDKRGMVEHLRALPRWMKMNFQTRQNDTQTVSRSTNVTSLCLARDQQSVAFLEGVKELDYLPFASRINCCLNNSNNPIPWSRTGPITLNVRLSSINQFLKNAATTTTYKLTDLQLWYQTEPESSKAPVQASSYVMVKHTLETQQSSINTKIPENVESVSCSFILASRENNNLYNNNECAVLPGVERVQFTFDDSQSLVKFNLKSQEEILFNYLASMGSRGINNIRLQNLPDEKRGYGIGLNFFRPISQSIGMEVVSSVDNTTPTSMYMYFKRVISF